MNAENLLLQEAALSRSLKKTYEGIKNVAKGKKNELFYSCCILSAYKVEGRPISDHLKSQLAIKSGTTIAKLEKDLIKFQSFIPKTDKQIATDICVKMKASVRIYDKFIQFKENYFQSLSPEQRESTDVEPLAVITLYNESLKHSRVQKSKFLKEFRKGSKLFDQLCNAYDEFMQIPGPPVQVITKMKEVPIDAPRKTRKAAESNKSTKKKKITSLVAYPEPCFILPISIEHTNTFQHVYSLLSK